MERSVPIWLVLLILIMGALFTVVFGAAVKSTATGGDRTGMFGRVAFEIASFPSLVRRSFEEVRDVATGAALDADFIVPRELPIGPEFSPIPVAEGIDITSPMLRLEDESAERGWRAMSGAFEIAGGVGNAIVLISPDNEIVHVWPLDEPDVADARPPQEKLLHGMELLPDGSVIFVFDGGRSIQRYDACGERLWAGLGTYHHSVAFDATDNTVWTIANVSDLAEISVDTGEQLRLISLRTVMERNPENDILGLRVLHEDFSRSNRRNTRGAWMTETFHLNDLDPLPDALTDQFPEFEQGDLLVSARSTNLVFVLDPDTLEIKWWTIGETQRQHDPDWLENGEILIYDNRMSRDFSEIISIDPATDAVSKLIDGSDFEFYSRIRGKSQRTPNAIVLSSPQQGRAFEVDDEGTVVLEIMNPRTGRDDRNLIITELRWLPEDFFE
ncbi:MAG: arylsulfotransferase family protein, partial [Pseudomonadota bacterium]